MRRKILVTVLSLLVVVSSLACVACSCKPDDNKTDVTAPVITVKDVPTIAKVGDTVKLPAATATDDTDGDVSSKIKVTAALLKADGSVQRELIYEKPGNVEQSFTITNNDLLNYKITYFVKDAAGNRGEAVFSLTATADNETGTLTLKSDETEITTKANADFVLPAAEAIDQPGDVNISERVVVNVYEVINEQVSSTIFTSFSDFTEAKSVRLPQGNYVAVYSVSDIAGNVFPDKPEISVTVNAADKVNLANDVKNFVIDSKVREGHSWVNEYGDLCFGNTSADNVDQTVGFTNATAKIFDQIVGVTFNADEPGANGAMFYTMAARGNKDSKVYPNEESCTWPSYLFIRIGKGGIEAKTEKSTDLDLTEVIAYKGDGKNLLDGKDHTIYIQWKNEGESVSDNDASLNVYGWVDVLPTETPSFHFRATLAGDSQGKGKIGQDAMELLWNKDTGAGWFTMDTYGSNRPYGDDHMRIKGFAIYDADETAFDTDIVPPVVEAEFDVGNTYPLGEEITFNQATVSGANEYFVYVVKPDKTKVDITDFRFTPQEEGEYSLVYGAYDEAHNFGYKAFKFKAVEKDEVAPVITLSSTADINATVGDVVTLPTFTAIDDKDGDITENVKIEVVGSEHVILSAGSTYSPMTAGKMIVYYTVSDKFGNEAKEQITVNVASLNKKGNILGENGITVSNSYAGLTTEEYIYDQKVSMIINFGSLNGPVQFNMRGPVNNQEWPNGMVLDVSKNEFIVSAYWRDKAVLAKAVYEKQQYMVGTDILLEYEVKNVIIENVEYIRTRVWVQGTELEFEYRGYGATFGLEDGVKGVYRKVSDFLSNAGHEENIYSTYFWVSAQSNGAAFIKKLRVDGESFEKPADPEIPEGFKLDDFVSGKDFITDLPKTLTTVDCAKNVIGKNSNEDYIAVTFKGSEATKGAFLLNITGIADGWNGGLILRLTQDGFEVRTLGSNATKIAEFSNFAPYKNGINATEYTIVYKMTYVREADMTVGIVLDVWAGEKGAELVKMTATLDGEVGEKATLVDGVLTVRAKAFTQGAQMQPTEIAFVSLDELNAGCKWTLTGIEQLAIAPDAPAKGYEKPETGTAEVTIDGNYKLSSDDEVVTAVTNPGEQYISTTFKYNTDATYHSLCINLFGSAMSTGWDGGLVLAITKDGIYFRTGTNGTNIGRPKLFAYGDGEYFTIVTKITYLEHKGLVYGVQLEMWAGKEGETLNKIENFELSSDKVSYDLEKKAWVFDYSMFTEDGFNAQYQLNSRGAWNNQTVPCKWEIKEVKILTSAPDAE